MNRPQHVSAFLFSLMGIGLLTGGMRFQLWANENCRWLLITFIGDSL
nr:MAG TPA_asm: hypothetical protein [Caudoviricetes sp.]